MLTLQGNNVTSIRPSLFQGLPADLGPILSPNPLVCNYTTCAEAVCTTPAAARLTCDACSLGYVFNTSTSSCVFPPFGPDSRQWGPAQQRSDFGGSPVLHRGATYSAGTTGLTPAHSRFVGYADGRFDNVTYRLDVAGAPGTHLECGSVATEPHSRWVPGAPATSSR